MVALKIVEVWSLRITDVQVRNPYNDEGSAILTIGAGTSFPFNLIDRQDGYDFQLSLRTPIELEAGEVVAFQVTCTLVGQPGAPGCQPTASFSGTLTDA